jgi:hypothetical protein
MQAVPDNTDRLEKWSGDVLSTSSSVNLIMFSSKSVTVDFIKQCVLIVDVKPPEGGTTTPLPGIYLWDIGSTIPAIAIPAPNYRFDRWNDSITDTSNSITSILNSDTHLTAFFIRQYNLILNVVPSNGGSITSSAQTYTLDEGSSVTLTAVPQPGFRFNGWQGDVSSSNLSITVIMNGNRNISVHFIRIYNLTVTANPLQGGIISQSGIFDEGDSVILNAVAVRGYRFDHWNFGASSSLSPQISIRMDKDLVATAFFTPVFTLTIINNAPDGGSLNVTSGIQVDKDQEVTLIATPNQNFRFDRFEGDASGNIPTIKIKMDKDKIVSVFFMRQYTLKIITNPSNGGTTSPSSGTHVVDAGTIVDLKAIPGSGYMFQNWSVDASDISSSISIVINSDMIVQANFTQFRTLSITINPPDSGCVVSPGSGHYPKDANVTLTPVAADGFTFDHWEGAVSGTSAPVSISMNSDKSVTAVFVKVYTLTVTISPLGSGSVSPVSGVYKAGGTVVLNAVSNPQYQFDCWTGDIVNTSSTVNFIMNSNKTITARFLGNAVAFSDTTHTYTHTLNDSYNGGTPAYSIDGNFSTAFFSDNSRSDGGLDLMLVSEHHFSETVDLKKIVYQISTASGAHGHYIRNFSYFLYVEYEKDNTWYRLPGSEHAGGGGDGDITWASGPVEYPASITDVQGLRAIVHAYAIASGGEGSCHVSASIFEIQCWGSRSSLSAALIQHQDDSNNTRQYVIDMYLSAKPEYFS